MISYSKCNTCTMRNCRRTPEHMDVHGQSPCSYYKGYASSDKLLNSLWEEQPRELMRLLAEMKMHVTIGANNKPKLHGGGNNNNAFHKRNRQAPSKRKRG